MDAFLEPASLYLGKVMHARLKPFTHRFNYRVLNLLIDLDRLNEAENMSKLFGINKPAPLSFHEKDFGNGQEKGLSSFIRQKLQDEDEHLKADKILLLCYPRILGYVFNPIAIYFCFKNGSLSAMVYEVRNTFGGKHIYVLPVKENEWRESGLRQMCEKTFHVSPFIDMNMCYFFRTTLPEEKIAFRILEKDDKGPLLCATLQAKNSYLTSQSIFKELILKPFFTLKVMIAIHFEALKLWFKGAKFHKNPHKKTRLKEVH